MCAHRRHCFVVTGGRHLSGRVTIIMIMKLSGLARLVITCDSEVIMFSPCVFVCLFVCGCLCLSRCLSGRFNYEGLVPHKQYFAGTLLGMLCKLCFTHSWRHRWRQQVTKYVKFWNWHISVNIWARASIKSSKCRKCSWLSFWYIQLPV